MTSLWEDRVSVARAAMAMAVATRLNLQLAGTHDLANEDPADNEYFTLCSAPPIGHHMETELLPLEAIMRDVELAVRSSEDDTGRDISTVDHRLSEVNAYVHDRLLNPILPLQAETPSVTATRPINEVYGETLRRASFAGSVAASSERYQKASTLLFDDGAPSEALKTYQDYEKRVQDAETELRELGSSGDTSQREDVHRRLERLRAEWIGIGRKQQIEDAFRALQEESEAAGYEDQRNALLKRFEAGKKLRIDAPGLSFHAVNLVPISPLFSEDPGPHWQQVKLGATDIQQYLDARARVALDLTDAQINRVVNDLKHLSFEFVECSILRDWLDERFFSERFWRLGPNDEPLSDGRGGGRMPAIPIKVTFVRNAEAVFEGETTARFGDEPEDREAGTEEVETVEVVAEADDVEERDSSGIEEAAQRAGLSSSLSLIARESQRVAQSTRRRVMSVSAERRPAGERADSADRAGRPLPQAMGVARTEERRSDRQIRQSPSSRPGTRVRATRPSRSSTSTFARSRDRDGVTVRDHRTSRSSSSSREPRRRDHRDRDTERVPSRAGRSIFRIRGEIVADGNNEDRLQGLSLGLIDPNESDGELKIELNRSSSRRLTFNQRYRREDGSREFELVLWDENDDELDRQLIELDEDEQTLELTWKLTAESVSTELAGKLTPVLHGYVIQAVPASPNPDEGLDWE